MGSPGPLLGVGKTALGVARMRALESRREDRLGWPPGTRVFEVDLPDVLAFKEAVLARCGAVPRCERVTVAAERRGDWPAALVAAGFDRARPAAWLAEGADHLPHGR